MVKRVKISVVNSAVLIVTQDPQQLHILALIEELMRESIPYQIQSNTKFMQFDFPNPNGRKFVVADNREGPLVLGTDFTISNVLVVGYPNTGTNNSNNYYSRPKQILQRYHEFIELGQYQVKSFRTTSVLRTDQTLSRTKKTIRLKSIQKLEKGSSQKVWNQKIPILICFRTGKQSQKFQELVEKIKIKNQQILICRRAIHLTSFIKPSERKQFYVLCSNQYCEDVLDNINCDVNLIVLANFGANLQMSTNPKVVMISSSIKEIQTYMESKSLLSNKCKESSQSLRDDKPLCSIVFRTEKTEKTISRQNTLREEKKNSQGFSSQTNEYFQQNINNKAPKIKRNQALKFTFINQPKNLTVKNTIMQQISNTSALKSSVDFSHQQFQQKQASQIRSSFSQNNLDGPRKLDSKVQFQSEKIVDYQYQQKKNTNSTQFQRGQKIENQNVKNQIEELKKNLQQQNSQAQTVRKITPQPEYYSEAKEQTKVQVYPQTKEQVKIIQNNDSILKKSILKVSQKYPIRTQRQSSVSQKSYHPSVKDQYEQKTARKKSLSNNLQPVTHIKHSSSQDKMTKSLVKKSYWTSLRKNMLGADSISSKSNFFKSMTHKNEYLATKKKSKYHQHEKSPNFEHRQNKVQKYNSCLFLFDRTHFQMYSLIIRKYMKKCDKILTHQTSSQLFEQIQLFDKFELVFVLSNINIRKCFPQILSLNNIYQLYIVESPISLISRNKIQITDINQLKDIIQNLLGKKNNDTENTSSTQAQFPFSTILYKNNNPSIKQVALLLSSKLSHIQIKKFSSKSDLVLLLQTQKYRGNRYLILTDESNYKEYLSILNDEQDRCFYLSNSNKNLKLMKGHKLTLSQYQDPYKQIISLVQRTQKFKTV